MSGEYKSPDPTANWELAKKKRAEFKKAKDELILDMGKFLRSKSRVEKLGKEFFAATPITDVMFSETIMSPGRFNDAINREVAFKAMVDTGRAFDTAAYMPLSAKLDDYVKLVMKFAKDTMDKVL